MNYFIAILTFLFGMQAFAREAATMALASKHGVSVTVGAAHACALANYKVTCWGDNKYGQTDVPPLDHPVQVITGGYFTCALQDNDELICWGLGNVLEKRQQLNGVKQITAGNFFYCYLEKKGVSCKFAQLGHLYYGEDKVPKLMNPRMVSANSSHACALDDTGVVCWGSGKMGEIEDQRFRLRQPKSVVALSYRTCALDARTGVHCWGGHLPGREGLIDLNEIPPLNNPSKIFDISYPLCALDTNGLNCWGVEEDDMPEVLRAGSWPKQVVDGCLVNANGLIECWKDQLTHVPDDLHLVVPFSLKDLERNFSGAAWYFYEDKAEVLNRVAQKLSASPLDEALRLFAMNIVAPIIENTTSAFVETKIFPPFRDAQEKFNAQFNIVTLLDIKLTQEIFDLSVVVVAAELSAARQYLSEAQRDEIQSIIVEIAKAGATANPKDGAHAIANVLSAHQNLIGTLTQNARTTAFGVGISKIHGYMEQQPK